METAKLSLTKSPKVSVLCELASWIQSQPIETNKTEFDEDQEFYERLLSRIIELYSKSNKIAEDLEFTSDKALLRGRALSLLDDLEARMEGKDQELIMLAVEKESISTRNIELEKQIETLIQNQNYLENEISKSHEGLKKLCEDSEDILCSSFLSQKIHT
ncbi:hypothetical protein Ciccas_010640 [Cichlidogyrus casuarinus]|uniref:Uncharacterized protein n=1 Tax=Cichlidogyrus casuarinus TaxID=1844966 RepID=A0ABD2PTL4_9PLAT